ncbi:MAG: OmpA family protein, partial [Variovorax sp.]|nr:OmpA family protein [Variovorax sp.]
FKLDASWSLLARSIVSDSEGQGTNAGNERHLQRHQIGIAYRPVDNDTWNALARYERRSENVVGAGNAAGSLQGSSVFGSDNGASLPGKTSADIVSAHLNYNPEPGKAVMARYAFKLSRADDGMLASKYWAHLVQARFTQDINQDWDVGVQAGLLYGKGGALQKTLGVEVGYQVQKNMWVSAGYNFVGLNDRDLTANEYTSKGAYVRLRFKFDETHVGFASAGADVKAAKAEKAEKVAAIEVAPLPMRTVLQAEALFEPTKSFIKPQAHDTLNTLAAQIKATDAEVVIHISHADAQGSADDRQQLIAQRTNAVRSYLIGHGVDVLRLRTDTPEATPPVAGKASSRWIVIAAAGQETRP